MKTSLFCWPALFAVAIFLCPSSLSAALLSRDWHAAGDGLLTYDDVENLEWLDLTQSVNRSYDDVSQHFALGGDFEGFRYANGTELDQLFSVSAGLPNVGGWFRC